MSPPQKKVSDSPSSSRDPKPSRGHPRTARLFLRDQKGQHPQSRPFPPLELSDSPLAWPGVSVGPSPGEFASREGPGSYGGALRPHGKFLSDPSWAEWEGEHRSLSGRSLM